eukprot:TRINITY_DN20138_c0_g1_i1.p1 TRINITY_DN20138_c0_g1~~TRINITY_DN20138_c0_g1_i1.p1  ORF type:complete len:118 (-),score=13.44 TRINITY_DN20138_c0_g1_i1:123-476(-)
MKAPSSALLGYLHHIVLGTRRSLCTSVARNPPPTDSHARKFAKPFGFWNLKSNQKEFLDGVFDKLGYKRWENWYDVTRSDIVRFGGRGLLRYYEQSVADAIIRVYPEHPWNVSLFMN